VEKDRSLADKLKVNFAADATAGGLDVVEADFLKWDVVEAFADITAAQQLVGGGGEGTGGGSGEGGGGGGGGAVGAKVASSAAEVESSPFTSSDAIAAAVAAAAAAPADGRAKVGWCSLTPA